MDPVLTEGYSWCRHCGRVGLLSFEHVPPRSVGNDRAVSRSDDPFDPNAVLHDVADWNDGAGVRTLCRTTDTTVGCNERASHWRYVSEYRRWHDKFVARAQAVAAVTNADPIRTGEQFTIVLDRGSAEPARFVRQVIGMVLALQATDHLWVRYDSLRQLVAPNPAHSDRPLAGGVDLRELHLYMSVCNTRWLYQHMPGGLVSVRLDRSPIWTPPGAVTSPIHDFLVLALSPFAFVLTTSADDSFGLDVTDWAKWPLGRRPNRAEAELVVPTADAINGLPRAIVYPEDYTVS